MAGRVVYEDMLRTFNKLDYETNEKGEKVAFKQSGNKMVIFPNGTIAEADLDGNLKMQVTKDGVILEVLKDGSKKQMKGGEVLITKTDGTRIQTREGSSIRLTVAPNGYMLQEDLSKGTKIHKDYRFPDGTETHEYPDAKIEIGADGVKRQTNSDGSTVETYPDGSKKVVMKSGEVKEIPPSST